MFDRNCFFHIYGHLANIFDIISDPFEVLGDEQEPRQPGAVFGFLRHRLHKFLELPLVDLVDLGIARFYEQIAAALAAPQPGDAVAQLTEFCAEREAQRKSA